MYLHKDFKIDLYKCKLHFFVVTDIRKQTKRLEKKTKGEWDLSYDGEAGGLSFSLDVDDYYILMRQDCLTHYYISHEIQHLIDKFCKDRDIEDEEARAYLSGYIHQEIHNFLRSKNIQVK